MPNQRTLSCKVEESFLDQVDQYAQEQGITRNDWVKQALQSVIAGPPSETSDRSDQILNALRGLDQRLGQMEAREAQRDATLEASLAATATPAVAPAQPDERFEQVLQWLHVIGQKLQRLETKEEEPMITRAELVAPDERIDQILQMMQGLGQQVQAMEAHTEEAIASLRPSLDVSPPPAIVPPPISPVVASAPIPQAPTFAVEPNPLDVPYIDPSNPPSETLEVQPETSAEVSESLIPLEQIYQQTQLNRQSIQFFAKYLGISEIEALETRTHWEYDYIAGGFRRR